NEVTSLAVPLTQAHVGAAGRLYAQMPDWQASAAALDAIALALDGFERGPAYIKVATVNALYGTRILALMQMARQVSRMLAGKPASVVTVQDIDRLARLKAPNTGKERRHISFASKLAHFFIDRDRFPIMDSFAKRVVAMHLGISPSTL